jgi:hypothetical protein
MPLLQASSIDGVDTLLAMSGAGPCTARTVPSTTPSSSPPQLDSSLSRLSRPDSRCCSLPSWSRRPFGRIVVFLAGSVAVVAFPTGSAVTPSTLSRVRPPLPAQTRVLSSASLAGLLNDRTRKEVRRSTGLLLSLLRRPVDRWRSNVDPSRRTGYCCVSPDHGHLDFGYLGIRGLSTYRLGVHTGLYSSHNNRTSRHCDCGVIATLRLPTFGFCSSLIVWCPRCDCGGMLDCVGGGGGSTTVGLPPIRVRVSCESLYM